MPTVKTAKLEISYGVNPPQTSTSMAEKFTGEFRRVVLDGVGHFPTREAPNDVSTLLIEHFLQG